MNTELNGFAVRRMEAYLKTVENVHSIATFSFFPGLNEIGPNVGVSFVINNQRYGIKPCMVGIDRYHTQLVEYTDQKAEDLVILTDNHPCQQIRKRCQEILDQTVDFEKV